jgi:K+-transporting ATPase ATPase A chain
MSMAALLPFALILAAVSLAAWPLGRWMHQLFDGTQHPLGTFGRVVEGALFRVIGTRGAEQGWRAYTVSMLMFSLVSIIVTFVILRLQHVLPLNPQGFGPMSADLAFNTAVSFATNTNWQAYVGEAAVSPFAAMLALTWQNFLSPAVGIAVMLAVARGLTRPAPTDGRPATLGNFWVDLTRAWLWVLLPLALVTALALAHEGVPQSLDGHRSLATLEGTPQTLPLGPVASQVAIKILGSNGGGFFGANAAHPFENPTAWSNLFQLFLMLLLPAALVFTFGRMTGDQRQGWTLYGAMTVMLVVATLALVAAETLPAMLIADSGLDPAGGNMEGKESRFGVPLSATWAALTTAVSNGSVNAMHDSFSALGGLVAMLLMMTGEVVFGGVGSGLYGMLVYVLLAVFVAGLMVGRSPEYLGKKIEVRETTMVIAYCLIMPTLVLIGVAASVVVPDAREGLQDAGPHGLSALLYAYASAAANNGSAFAGLAADRPWFNVTLGVAMLAGRYLAILPLMVIAGAMASRKAVAAGPGTFPTHGPVFGALLIAIVMLLGALTYAPVLVLGPILDHLAGVAGRSF